MPSLNVGDHDFKCAVCGRVLKNLDTGWDDSPAEQSCYDLSNVTKMSAGYGSRYDGDIIYFGICDECIDKHKDRFFYAGDYMDGTNKESEDFKKHVEWFNKPHLRENDKYDSE